MQLTARVDGGAAELWKGSALLGILHEEHGEIVVRLESHAGGPVTVSAIALERVLGEAREGLRVAAAGGSPRTDRASGGVNPEARRAGR